LKNGDAPSGASFFVLFSGRALKNGVKFYLTGTERHPPLPRDRSPPVHKEGLSFYFL
jgi:hypothetical protein